jgi:hypothetical protein
MMSDGQAASTQTAVTELIRFRDLFEPQLGSDRPESVEYSLYTTKHDP